MCNNKGNAMKKFVLGLSLAAFFMVAGGVLASVSLDREHATTLADLALCNERVIDEQVLRGETTEHAFNVGKLEMANMFLQLCNDDGVIPLAGGAIHCTIVMGVGAGGL